MKSFIQIVGGGDISPYFSHRVRFRTSPALPHTARNTIRSRNSVSRTRDTSRSSRYRADDQRACHSRQEPAHTEELLHFAEPVLQQY
jgi:hypothetical protein